MPPRAHKILRYELPMADALDIVIQAVQAIPAEIEQVDDQKGQLTAKTRQTLKSRGEHIRIQMEKLEKDTQCQGCVSDLGQRGDNSGKSTGGNDEYRPETP